ncbi:hypothetical protein SAMN02746095_00449 [Acidocella aminolytica 101 = DSM 11237]|jgi:hypothetical protein|nr:hypothetical protein SAMN02746095_00449 [Acidocella aminolytica 101 = DSM 11237]
MIRANGHHLHGRLLAWPVSGCPAPALISWQEHAMGFHLLFSMTPCEAFA